jgi:DNA-binding ferritin-like protein
MSFKNDDKNVSESIKNVAGNAFHAMHDGLEATENAAMKAVDTTADAIENLTDDTENHR